MTKLPARHSADRSETVGDPASGRVDASAVSGEKTELISSTLAMTRMRHALPLVLAAMVVTSAAAQGRRFTVAMVRPDGALVPFAAYDAGRWERAWPEADEATNIEAIDNVPSVWRRRGGRVPDVWRVWPASGAPGIQVQVNGVEVVEAHCQAQVALKTDLLSAKVQHPLKFGIAIDSASIPVSAVEEVHRSDAMWAAAERSALASFSHLEAAQATRDRRQLPRETPVPVAEITALYRQMKAPRSPMYFVAEKKYKTARSPQDAQCTDVTIMTGWLVPMDSGTYAVLDPKVFLTDCDAKEVRTAVPLGAFRVSNQLYWVIQEHGYEDESYLIAELRQSRIRYPIQVNGGGC